jgi:hypothetical protein
MRNSKLLNVALVAVLLGSTASTAYAWPNITVHWDPKKPLQPPSVSATVGNNTYTATPSPVGPAVTSNGHGEGDKFLNKAAGPATATNKAVSDSGTAVGKAANDAGTAINKGFDDAGRGIGHFFNEIGMAWANFKNDLARKAENIIGPWIDTGRHYLILAAIGLAGMLLFLPLMTAYLMARFLRQGGDAKLRRKAKHA